jgi:hypothetical protein
MMDYASRMMVPWNLLKLSLVKMFSRLRRQDKKAPKFSHLINITLLEDCHLIVMKRFVCPAVTSRVMLAEV